MNNQHRPAIYAIHDTVANDLAGNVHALSIHKSDASAVRYFTDGLADVQTSLNKHAEDYNLIRLGFLNDKHEIIPEQTVILTGAAWKAAQTKPIALEA